MQDIFDSEKDFLIRKTRGRNYSVKENDSGKNLQNLLSKNFSDYPQVSIFLFF